MTRGMAWMIHCSRGERSGCCFLQEAEMAVPVDTTLLQFDMGGSHASRLRKLAIAQS